MTSRPAAPSSGGPVLPAEAVAELRHELRTPVNVITGYAEMLLEDAVGDATDPALATALEQLGGEMREVLRLIAATLPPSAEAVAWDTVRELRTRLLERQARVEVLLAAASASPSAARPEVADDLRRMTTAAGRLAAIEAHGAAEMAAVAVERVAEPVAPRPDAVAPAYLLVVDDLEDNRAVLSRRLERLGHRVACAVDGHAALAMAAAEPFDVILLDVMMPGLDGFSTLVALKGDAATCDVPVIMISALDDLGSTARCIAQGAEDYLPKPFEPLLLQARIGASLERKRLRDRERDFLTQTARVIDAARAVEEGRYDSEAMAEIAARGDELGRLARVFDGMAAEVRAREARLQQQLGDLQREIDAARGTVMAGPTTAPTSMAAVAESSGSPMLEGPGGHTLRVGQRLAGRYEIFAVVGQGGMGRVYRATDRELGAEVAIKVLRPDVLDVDPSLRDAIKSEILLSRRITHQNVVRTHDFGEADGLAFITMEYVDGVSLRGMLESRGQLAPGATIALGLQLLRALQAAHDVGVVHRDIKPDNVLLSTTGVLKVMDFGIARLLETAGGGGAGDGSGTLGYMAPEQLMEEPVDARADLYASGVLLYECLTGRLPFDASNPFALMGQLMRGVVPDACTHAPEVSPALSSLVASLLRMEPGERPATARQVEVALEGMR